MLFLIKYKIVLCFVGLFVFNGAGVYYALNFKKVNASFYYVLNSKKINKNTKPSLLLKKAQQGDAEAQFQFGHNIGPLFFDLKYQSEWNAFLNSSSCPAKSSLCKLQVTQTNNNTSKREAIAVAWVEKAALQKHAKAQYYRCYYYINGFGNEQNYKKAINWCKKSAANGYHEGARALWQIYRSGTGGIPQNIKKARHWVKKAVNLGCLTSKSMLAKHCAQKSRDKFNLCSTTYDPHLAFKLSKQVMNESDSAWSNFATSAIAGVGYALGWEEFDYKKLTLHFQNTIEIEAFLTPTISLTWRLCMLKVGV